MDINLSALWPYLFSIIIIIATVLVAALLNSVFSRFIKRSSKILNNDPTNYNFIRHATRAVIYIVGFSWRSIVFPS